MLLNTLKNVVMCHKWRIDWILAGKGLNMQNDNINKLLF